MLTEKTWDLAVSVNILPVATRHIQNNPVDLLQRFDSGTCVGYRAQHK